MSGKSQGWDRGAEKGQVGRVLASGNWVRNLGKAFRQREVHGWRHRGWGQKKSTGAVRVELTGRVGGGMDGDGVWNQVWDKFRRITCAVLSCYSEDIRV